MRSRLRTIKRTGNCAQALGAAEPAAKTSLIVDSQTESSVKRRMLRLERMLVNVSFICNTPIVALPFATFMI